MTKGNLLIFFMLCLPVFAQQKEKVAEMPNAPKVSDHEPESTVDLHQPATWTGSIGIGHGLKKGYQPVGSINYRLSQHYGLFAARSTVSYSGGLTFSFGHKK